MVREGTLRSVSLRLDVLTSETVLQLECRRGHFVQNQPEGGLTLSGVGFLNTMAEDPSSGLCSAFLSTRAAFSSWLSPSAGMMQLRSTDSPINVSPLKTGLQCSSRKRLEPSVLSGKRASCCKARLATHWSLACAGLFLLLHHCICYFSCFCDEVLDRSSLREEWSILAYGLLEVYIYKEAAAGACGALLPS